MAFHIVTNRPTDLLKISQGARLGLNPRHSMSELAKLLNATFHDGSHLVPGLADIVLGKLTRTSPLWWAIARKLRHEVVPGDVIFCTGEDVGVPVSIICGGIINVKVAVMVHYIDRFKGRVALRIFGLKKRISLFCTVARPQAVFLCRFVYPLADRVLFVWDQTDTNFFRPGASSPGRSQRMIMSVGLEQRDYTTLAEATAELDVNVEISGYSADTRLLSKAFPDVLPANMSRKFYPWLDLLQLYRDASIVVVCLFPNRYAAGVQAIMEALACARPVIVTATEGLEGYLDYPGRVFLVPPQDPGRLREAIISILENNNTDKNNDNDLNIIFSKRHRLEEYVATLVTVLRTLAPTEFAKS